jgi:hypothetical protein
MSTGAMLIIPMIRAIRQAHPVQPSTFFRSKKRFARLKK